MIVFLAKTFFRPQSYTIPEKQQNEKGKKSSSVTVMTDDSFYFDGVRRGIGWTLG